MKKVFFEAEVREWLSQYLKEEITFSRFVEMFNEKVSVQSVSESERELIFEASVKHILSLVGNHHVAAEDILDSINNITDVVVETLSSSSRQQDVNPKKRVFDIDCGGMVMIRVEINDNYPTITHAMNGGGYPIDVSEIRIAPFNILNNAIQNAERRKQ